VASLTPDTRELPAAAARRWRLADAAPPRTTADLSPPDRLLLRAARDWLAGMRDSSGARMACAWNALAAELGPARGHAAMAGLLGLTRALCHARRTFRTHWPGCPCLSRDEIALVALLDACRDGTARRARAHAEWLTHADGVGDLLEAGYRLASATDVAGYGTPSPNQDT